MAGSLDTTTKIRNLIDTTDLNVLRLSLLCQRFGLKGTSDANIQRALQKKNFSNEVDQELRPFILRIENLIRATDSFFKISFNDLDHIELMLRLLEDNDVEIVIKEKRQTTSNTQQ